MKAYEMPAKITEDGKLDIPSLPLSSLPRGRTVRLIVLVSETEEEER